MCECFRYAERANPGDTAIRLPKGRPKKQGVEAVDPYIAPGVGNIFWMLGEQSSFDISLVGIRPMFPPHQDGLKKYMTDALRKNEQKLQDSSGAWVSLTSMVGYASLVRTSL